MSIVSKLTLPALLGGVAALIASGVLSPPVFADNTSPAIVARIVLDQPSLALSSLPDPAAPHAGSLPARYWVWVERCHSDQEKGHWCLIERGDQRGWVQASHLQLFDD